MHSVIKSTLRNTADNIDLNNCLTRGQLGSRLVPTEYSRGTHLCSEGESAEGIFNICAGQAKEYFTSAVGKAAIIRIVGPGDIVGLEAVMGDSLYQTTVEAMEPATAHFIPTREIFNSMRSDERFRLAVARQLSNRCKCAYHEIRQFRESSAPARVARFLLDVLRGASGRRKANRLCINLTREEIAQSIGTSRESVSRIVTFLQRKGWILIDGNQWRIQNRQRLAALATEQRGGTTGAMSLHAA